MRVPATPNRRRPCACWWHRGPGGCALQAEVPPTTSAQATRCAACGRRRAGAPDECRRLGQDHHWQAEHVLLALPPAWPWRSWMAAAIVPICTAHGNARPPGWRPHAKYVAVYETPFWREQGLSGQTRSARGPLQKSTTCRSLAVVPRCLVLWCACRFEPPYLKMCCASTAPSPTGTAVWPAAAHLRPTRSRRLDPGPTDRHRTRPKQHWPSRSCPRGLHQRRRLGGAHGHRQRVVAPLPRLPGLGTGRHATRPAHPGHPRKRSSVIAHRWLRHTEHLPICVGVTRIHLPDRVWV